MSSWQRSTFSTQTLTGAAEIPDQVESTPGLKFARFFSQVMRLNIHLLPMAWDAGRESIGAGATSRINEAKNLNMSLAFKRADRNRSDEQIFDSLTREITILALKSISDHPNIAQLQGICWDVSAGENEDDDRLWPVLIFPKSQFGDLGKLIAQSDDRSLDFQQRSKLCVDVGTAIMDMHALGIVHGDIKPGNVLVFPSTTGAPHIFDAKVTDFGFSTFSVDENERLRLPISRPWNAPEIDRTNREWTLSQAKLADLFSFGILCFWVLFEPQLCEPSKLLLSMLGIEIDNPVAPAASTSTEATLLQIKDRVQDLAPQLVAAERNKLGTLHQEALCAFMVSCLSSDPSKRTVGLEEFRAEVEKTGPRLVGSEQPPPWLRDIEPNDQIKRFYSLPKDIIDTGELKRIDFQLDGSLLNLYASDYRVRKHIARSLGEAYDQDGSCAVPLAFCYLSGFGAPKDVVKGQRILETTDYNSNDVRMMLHDLNRRRTELPSVLGQVTDENGHGDIKTLTEIYVAQGRLETASVAIERELGDLEAFNGPETSAVLQLRKELIDIRVAQGRMLDAEGLLLATLDTCSESRNLECDDNDVQVLVIMSQLASRYRDLNRLEDAAELERHLKQQASPSTTEQQLKGNEPFHPTTDHPMKMPLEGFSELALEASGQEASHAANKTTDDAPMLWLFARCHLFIRHRKWRNVDRVLTDTRRVCKELISDHLVVMDTMNILTKIRLSLGRLDSAKDFAGDVVKIGGQQWGEDHPTVLTGKGNLAIILRNSGDFFRAEALAKELIDAARRKWGDEHDVTRAGSRILSSLYVQIGRLGEAETLTCELLKLERRINGEDSPNFVDALSTLALIYEVQGNLDAAEELAEQALKTSVKMLGPRHERSLVRMHQLSSIMRQQGASEEAEQIEEICLKLRRGILGNDHPDTVSSMEHLARIRSAKASGIE